LSKGSLCKTKAVGQVQRFAKAITNNIPNQLYISPSPAVTPSWFVKNKNFVYFRLLMQFSGLPADTLQIWQMDEQDTKFLFLTNQDGVTAGEGEMYSWFGMLFVIAFANLCTWPTAFFLHKLPLLNQVL